MKYIIPYSKRVNEFGSLYLYKYKLANNKLIGKLCNAILEYNKVVDELLENINGGKYYNGKRIK